MPTYEFQSTLHRTKTEMLDALVWEWLSAGSKNTREVMLRFLEEATDEELTSLCVRGWGLDHPDGDETTWLENCGADRSDVKQAFAKLRFKVNLDWVSEVLEKD